MIISEETRHLLDKNTVEFYHRRSMETLNAHREVATKSGDKCYVFLGVVGAILAGLTAMYQDGLGFVAKVQVCIGIITCMVCIVLMLWKVIYVHDSVVSGTRPGRKRIEEFVSYYRNKGEDVYINVMADELDSIDKAIGIIVSGHENRMKWYRVCLKIFLSGILIAGCLFFLVWV